MESMNSDNYGEAINKKAVIRFIVVVLTVIALSVWGGTFLGKSQGSNENQELNTKLESTQDQLSRLQSVSETLQKDKDTQQTELTSMQQQLSQLQLLYASLQKERDTLLAQLSLVQSQLSQLQSQYNTLQGANASLQSQLSSAQSQNAQLATQLSSAQQQVTSLQTQLGAWYAWASKSPISTSAVPGITLSPTSGQIGSSVTVTGSGMVANSSGSVVFDVNRNGASDPGEPLQNVTTSSTGTFLTSLVVPVVPPGAYPVLAAFPAGAPAQASASFTVTIP